MNKTKPQTKVPEIGVGGVVFKQGKILLVQRKNPPAQNQWAIPGGRLRFGESLKEACEREILEETGVRVKAGEIVHVFEVLDRDPQNGIRFHYVIIDLLAEYVSGELQAGDDALQVGWFTPQDIKQIKVNPFTLKLLKEKFSFY